MSKNNEFELQKPLHKRNDTVVFDLDGTLADNMTWEKHHKGKKGKNQNFAAEALEVGTHGKVVKKLNKAKDDGDNVVILTARSAHYRDETKKWLAKNGIPYDALVMRPSDNLSSDKKVKRELLEEDILPKKNVKMFAKLGIDAKKVKP
jgi:uncharacterized HAD superfamily protein